MLSVNNVCLIPDENNAFSHSFAPGEISVVLGANQSGKTNLCRLIAGLNTRAQGEVSLDGHSLVELGPRSRPVSMVYQAFVNYPNLTVFENIASPLRAKKTDTKTLSKTVAETAEKLQISQLLDRLPSELSGGQQQRVAIARALAQEAQVLLLDEPLVNLDFKLREALEVELRELLRASNTVVVYTSSDPRDAFTLGDQLLLLEKGSKIQAGRPLEVYESPSCPAAMALLADPDINRFYRNGRLCALRPEHLELSLQGHDPALESSIDFDMQVTAYETNGDESFVHGQVQDTDWVMRSRGMLPVSVGQVLQIHAAPHDVVQF
ncbi:ABC transporter ATP-binding protein [Congregibacter variabilis]|uniref:ABC transporter ATP-binding protein n=1 Tax=Congregibacter variabilis TaxID=3081200 RepID=A0ABZ0I7S0_9GAMM|nr:ABC transporter ATP-binding protein [Congregibacter sp. IMCC43200]